MKKLTTAEEQVMQAVWAVGRGSAGQIRERLAADGHAAKPTTVSTVLRILVDKQFLTYEAFGRTYVYSPLVERADYSAGRLRSFIRRFFDGEPARLVSFLAEREDLSLADVEALMGPSDSESDGDASDRPESPSA